MHINSFTVFPPNRRRIKKTKKVSATHTCSPLIRTAVNNTLRQSCQELSDEGQGSPQRRLCCLSGGPAARPATQPQLCGWVSHPKQQGGRGIAGSYAGGKEKCPGRPCLNAFPLPSSSYRHFPQKSWLCSLLVETLGLFLAFFKTCLGEVPSTFIHIKDLYFYVLRDMKRGGETRRGESCVIL